MYKKFRDGLSECSVNISPCPQGKLWKWLMDSFTKDLRFLNHSSLLSDDADVIRGCAFSPGKCLKFCEIINAVSS